MGEKLSDPWGLWLTAHDKRHMPAWANKLGVSWLAAYVEAEDLKLNSVVKSATIHRLCLASERDALQARVDEALEVMRRVEWVRGSDDGDDDYCAACREYQHDGHADDCRLDAQLRKGGDDE